MSVRLSYADCDGNGTINPATEILEENNYYPFGLQHQGYNDIANSCRNEETRWRGFAIRAFKITILPIVAAMKKPDGADLQSVPLKTQQPLYIRIEAVL
ncbi:hypothetical protein [Paenimyroides aestuarii]|uniref:Uncharacterized protein n=1 Tax=Paenimyroides aestuarii TaxID=2968490 RepID=A0ABY5NVP0_9FLAO|nr:hypothetical protein [Paenimyroides aestuarii]UUV22657.1 hypothetical protein NPX36_06340 [Paenimyroides aestuarii]